MPLPSLAADEIARACELLTRLYYRAPLHKVHVPATFLPEDVDWLQARCLLPGSAVRLTHASLLTAVLSAKQQWSIEAGAQAFTASLDSDDPPHGAFLEAVLLAHLTPMHEFESRSKLCRVCGLEQVTDVDAAKDFLRWHTWGTGIPGSVPWACVALGELTSWLQRIPSETARGRLLTILHTLDTLPGTARVGAAVAAVSALGYFDEGKRHECSRGVVETLAFSGILEAPPHVGFATRFVSYAERDARPTVRTECDAPLGFWKGAHGVNWAAVKKLFGFDKDTQIPRLQARTRCRPRPHKPRSTPLKTSLKRRAPLVGDAWVVRLREDGFVLVYVWKVERKSQRSQALVEYLDWFGASVPAPNELPPLGVRGRKEGRWQMVAHRLDETSGIALVAQGLPGPATKLAAPDRTPVGSATELVYLARWCFPELDD